MDSNMFEIAKLVLQIALLVATVFVIPSVKKWMEANTTKEQREEAKFWTGIAVKAAESIYKEKGQGQLKKEWVLEWLNKNNVKITMEQANILIDMVVQEFNKNGWNLPILKMSE